MHRIRLSSGVIAAFAFVVTLSGWSVAQVAPSPGGVYGVQGSGSGSITIDPAGSGATVGAGYSASGVSQASSGGSTGGRSSGNTGSVSSCVWTPDPSQTPGTQTGGYDAGMNYIQPGVPGQWYLVSCNGLIGQAQFVPQGPGQGPPAAPPPPSPQQLMQDARSHLSLPAPAVQLSPAADQWQYAQMPTWAWLPQSGWAPLTATAAAGPVVVTVTATPARLEFTYQTSGTSSAMTACGGPGTPYSDQLAAAEDPQLPVQAASPDCGWTWRRSSADTADQKYAVTAHVIYHAVWSVTGAAGGGDLGELTSQDTTFRVSVGEIQAVNTPSR